MCPVKRLLIESHYQQLLPGRAASALGSHAPLQLCVCCIYRQGQVKATDNGGVDFKDQPTIPQLTKIASFMGNLRI